MGFRNGAYATVWDVRRMSDTVTQLRLSTSRRDKNTGKYVQDFSGYVSFVGTANAAQALKMRPRDRIRLVEVESTNKYDKERNTTYYNYTCFNFEVVTSSGGNSDVSSSVRRYDPSDPLGLGDAAEDLGTGFMDDVNGLEEDGDLPF